MEDIAEAPLDAEGEFSIPAMAAGQFALIDRFAETAVTRISLPERTNTEPDAETNVTCTATKMILVRGTCVFRESGKPAVEKSIKISHGGDSGASRELTVYSRTGSEGRIEAYVFSGTIDYESLTVVDGFNQAHRFEQDTDLFDIGRAPLATMRLAVNSARTFPI